MRRHWKKIVLGLLVLFLIVRVLDFTVRKPEELRISEETTFLTGPLDKDGQVDYEAAMNARNRKGVTFQNNAGVPFAQVMGPNFVTPRQQEQFFAKLGIPIPPVQGDYFLDFEQFAKKIAPRNYEEYSEKLSGQYFARDLENGEQWSRQKYPELAAWVDYNKIPLDKIIAALQRPKWYLPVVAPSAFPGGPPMFVVMALEHIYQIRSVIRLFSLRIDIAIQENRIDDACKDLLAGYRLSRFVSYDFGLISSLVGVAYEAVMRTSSIRLLNSGRVTSAQLSRYQQGIAQLPPLCPFSQKIHIDERFTVLSVISALSKGFTMKEVGLEFVDAVSDLKENGLGMVRPFLSHIDWNIVSKRVNQVYNEQTAVLEQKSYSDYQDAIHEQTKILLERISSSSVSRVELGFSLVFGPEIVFQKKISEFFANHFIAVFSMAISQSAEAEFRFRTKTNLMQIAMALEQYRLRTGKFPEKLADLVPGDLKKIPDDIYSEKPLIYNPAPEENSYVLYSIGPNLEDEKGRIPSWDLPEEDDPEDGDPEDDNFEEDDFEEEELETSDDISIHIKIPKK